MKNHYILNPYHFIQPALRENVSKVELNIDELSNSDRCLYFDQIKNKFLELFIIMDIRSIMKALEEKILKEGIAEEGNVLKVDNFLNHQIDVAFT